jgi:hypothetical protein
VIVNTRAYLITASVTIVGSGEEGEELVIMGVLVTVHHQLVSSDGQH